MAGKKYRLEPVPGARAQAKRKAERLPAARMAQLAEAEAELARREREVESRRERQAAARAEMLEAMSGGAAARRFREVLAAYEAQKDLILIGAYKKGSDPRTDLAIARADAVNAFLRQRTAERTPPAAALGQPQKMF